MSLALFDLSGRVALVTGSSRGLGFSMARGLARAGARVHLNGRDPATLDAAVSSLRAEGLEAAAACFDVTDDGAVERGVAAVGLVDVLVNNAGMNVRRPLEEFAVDSWRAILEANLTSAFLVARAVAAGMLERGSGKIVNVCSLQSELGRPTIAPYAATKGALKMLTKGMCADWGPRGLQVNGIGPGYFVTEMTAPLQADPEFDAWVRRRTPAGRWGDPEDLVGSAVFLASAASDFVNGQILYVDGGLLAVV